MPARLIAALLLAIVFPLSATADEPLSFSADPRLAPLVQRWSDLTDLFDVPGAAVAVVRDGKVYVTTFGFRDPATRLPVTPDTLFYIASITKTYNATAIGTLVDQGRLSLEDTIKDHLSWLDLPDPELNAALTVRDLLSHRYGISSGTTVLLDAFTGEITDDRYAYWLARCEINGSLDYSNVHYTLVGRLIEEVTGMDWRDYLEQAVLSPAGLDRTTGYASVLYDDPDSATPTTRIDGEWRQTAVRKIDRTMHAAGGLGTSAREAARYLMLHLGNGVIGGQRVVSASYMEEMRTLQASLPEPDGSIRVIDGFGLGWQVGTYAGAAPLSAHGGGYDGTSAWFALLPDQQAGIALLINGGGPARGWGDIVAIDLLEALTGVAPPWSPYERYPERIRRMKSGAEKTPPVAAAAGEVSVLPSSSLSRPIGMYTGWFHNADLGTLVVTATGDGLSLQLGNLPLTISPGVGPDLFIIEDEFDPPPPCRFVVTADGKIDEVRIDEQDLGELVFRR